MNPLHRIAQWLRNILPQPILVRALHLYQFGRLPDIRYPTRFPDLLARSQLRDDPRVLAKYVDKLGVRQYVAKVVGEEHLVPLIASYRTVDDINWHTLPRAFVLKATHGSAMTLIVRDKENLDTAAAEQTLESWLATDVSRRYGSLAYQFVPKQIVAETLLQENGRPPADYKFYTFSGTVRFFHVDEQRNEPGHRKTFFAPDGRPLIVTRGHVINADNQIQLPDNLHEMIDIAERLAGTFPFVRVDLYNVGGRILFSELTFYPGGGLAKFNPPEFDLDVGAMWLEGAALDEKWIKASSSTQNMKVKE